MAEVSSLNSKTWGLAVDGASVLVVVVVAWVVDGSSSASSWAASLVMVYLGKFQLQLIVLVFGAGKYTVERNVNICLTRGFTKNLINFLFFFLISRIFETFSNHWVKKCMNEEAT